MRDINLLHPEVKAKAEELVAKAQDKLNLRLIITQTLRTQEEQVALFAQGRQSLDKVNELRKLANYAPLTATENRNKVTNASSAADSFHGYGLAFDIAVVDSTGRTINWNKSDWNSNNVDDWMEIGKLGESIGLEWGGSWKSFPDIPHYQLTLGWTIKSLKAAGVTPGKTITRHY